ncbi:hypothetical protein Tco_0405398 [Tanacetum coccineum]
MLSESFSRSSSESKEKAHHHLRRISASEERTTIRMMELLDLVPSCLINFDLELHEIIILASILEHLCNALNMLSIRVAEVFILSFLDYFETLHLEYEHVVVYLTQLERGSIQRIFLTGFPARSVGSTNVDALDSQY